jgi:hypothetical protein
MNLSDDSYNMIYGFIITAIILSIFIVLGIRYHEAIIRLCKRNQVAPELSELKLEIKPV